MNHLTPQELKEIEEYRKLFPRSVSVHAEGAEEGGFTAEVRTFPGCFTEADTFPELIEMVNDAIRCMLDIPLKYASYMPSYMPPITVAMDLDFMPGTMASKDFMLDLAVREEAAR